MFNKISFIGAGSMAEAIIAGIINQEVIQREQIFVTNKNNQQRLEELRKEFHVQCLHHKDKVIKNAEVVILSTKPADLTEAVTSIKQYIKPSQLVISVVAGISTEYIGKLLGADIPIIRVMPNTSAQVGYSASAIARGAHATEDHVKMSESLFQAIGTTEIIAEEDMHIVTGISGSGPAYIYYLVEAMEQAAMEAGLDSDVAKALITQTVIGAGEMLKRTDKPTEILREDITSPAGTTEAGLQTLASYRFQEAVKKCVHRARDRSIELGEKL